DRLELRGGDLAALALGARLLESGGTQEAPDMIGAKRRLGAWHDGSCVLGKTVIARAGGRSSHRRSLQSITSVDGYFMPRHASRVYPTCSLEFADLGARDRNGA